MTNPSLFNDTLELGKTYLPIHFKVLIVLDVLLDGCLDIVFVCMESIIAIWSVCKLGQTVRLFFLKTHLYTCGYIDIWQQNLYQQYV